MEYCYSLAGTGAPILHKFQIGETMATAGVPIVVGGSNNEGAALASTTAAASYIGITLDTATLVTAQDPGSITGADTARFVTVIINPMSVIRAKLAGSSTSGAALSAKQVTSAAADGLTITTGFDYSSPTMDEGSIWGYIGANAGIRRKITSVSSTVATVIVAFPNDTTTSDFYLHCPFATCEKQYVQLTTLLDQVDATAAVDTNNANFTVLEIDHRDASDSGTTNSSVYIVPNDSLFNNLA